MLPIPDSLSEVHDVVAEGLERVERRFNEQLRSDMDVVNDLCEHLERYRGKMLRPTLVLLSAMACGGEVTNATVTSGAVCEMIHMATLVHDDVLDEAETRRRGLTVNRLRGNEAAVMLGDYLFASAYHLCSQLDAQRTALIVADASRVTCAGELLQLDRRHDFDLPESTYDRIILAKTGALIRLACRLGAMDAPTSDETVERLASFGDRVGMAFQIQDDVLDLTGDETVVGKTLGIDLRKGKLTLPVIHHLRTLTPEARETVVRHLQGALEGAPCTLELESTGSLAYARDRARGLVEDAVADLDVLDQSPAKEALRALALAVIHRDR